MPTPGRVKSSDIVRDLLAASGFTGALTVTTDLVNGRAQTTVHPGPGALFLCEVDTGMDGYTIAISDGPLSKAEADDLWQADTEGDASARLAD